MSSFDPQNADPRSVEAKLSCVIESPRLQFVRGGGATDPLLNDYFDPEGRISETNILRADCVPNEAGISSMQEATQEARKGYTVAIKIHCQDPVTSGRAFSRRLPRSRQKPPRRRVTCRQPGHAAASGLRWSGRFFLLTEQSQPRSS